MHRRRVLEVARHRLDLGLGVRVRRRAGHATAGRTAGAYLHSTVAADGAAELALFGVAGALLLAGAFAALPGVTGHTIANVRIAGSAVWLLAVGAAVVGLSLLVAGYVQGVLWAQGVRDGTDTFAGAAFVDTTNAIRPLLWLRVAGEGLVALGWVAAFQQVFSTSTAYDADGE